MTHTLHTRTVHKTASLTDEAILHIVGGAHNTKHIQTYGN